MSFAKTKMIVSEKSNDKLIDLQCPYCGSPLAFPEGFLGTAQECPHCFETIVVRSAGSKTGGKLPLPIKTSRLNLRPLRTEDQPDWLEFVTDEDSYRYLSYYEPDYEDARCWLEDSKVLKLTHPKGCLTIGIELQKEAKIIGHLPFHLTDSEGHRQGSFNLMVHPAYRRQGYGTEALLGIIEFGFNSIALHDIRVGIDSRNIAVRQMVEKAGMKLEGEFVEEYRVKGEWVSIVYYVIFSRTWRNA